jgi:hypothetical protein
MHVPTSEIGYTSATTGRETKKYIYINDLNTFSSDLIPFCCSVFSFVPFFSLLYLPSPDQVAP